MSPIYKFVLIAIAILLTTSSCKKEDEVLFRDEPQNIGVVNAYKKAHQFSEIRWRAKDYIPTVSSAKGFRPNVEYKGLWYSSTKEPNKFIGYDISLTTAMTALNNPYSLLYTEDILEERSASSYGNIWHGTNCGAYMGVVCSSFVAYVLGFDIQWSTKDYPYLCRQGILQEVPSYDIQLIQLMDIIYEEGHVAVITDIWRNEYGEIAKVEISEAVYNTVVSKVYNVIQLQNRIRSSHFKALYRYVGINKNTEYEMSPFVAVLDEPNIQYIYNEDICTYGGDYATFKSDEDIIINYNKGEYTSLEVYKDQILVHNMQLSKDINNHIIDITSLQLKDGIYRARLINGNNQSDYTHFEISDIDVNVTGNIYSLNISYNSPNANPIYIDIVDRQSYPIAMYVLTPEDIDAGNCNISIPNLETWNNSYFGNELFIKVAFKAEYGKLYSNPIKIVI